ncbi:MAG: cation:proton antiporter [Methylobacteriaceae bacterium]|nr:cation:proton antiporter [Methylobacteriaceae bacterium]
MAGPVDVGTYKEAMLFLGTAGIVVPLFSRLKVSPVLGFIGAGALLGPHGIGRWRGELPWLEALSLGKADEIGSVAEFGVVFLLFAIGIELSFERLRTLRRLVFGLGTAQVLLSAALIGALALAAGLPPPVAAIAGIALALSSTAIVIPILAEQRRLNTPTGRASFSVLLFQDLAVAPILFTVLALGAAQPGESLTAEFLFAISQAAFAIVIIIGLGRVALRPLFQLVAQTRSPELFVAACLLVVLATAILAAKAGLSMALGAFLAGLLLAETEYRRAIEATVEPFKGLLLGVFFLSVGMGLDLGAIAAAPVLILLGAVAVVALKAAVIAGLARLFGLPRRVGLEMGLLLGAGGEFAFVLLGAAMAGGLVPRDIGQALLLVTTVTMVALPLLARLGRRLGLRLARADPAAVAPEPPPETSGAVIVAGFGRVGQLVAEMLERHAIPYLAIDADPSLVAAKRRAGKPVYVGDPTASGFLAACGLDTARALVVTLDSPAAVQAIVAETRLVRPDLTIVARARDARHARDLYRLGVNDAVPETIEASLQLSEAVLVDLGVPMGPVIASIHERRDEFRRALQERGEDAAKDKPGPGPFRARRTVGKRRA